MMFLAGSGTGLIGRRAAVASRLTTAALAAAALICAATRGAAAAGLATGAAALRHQEWRERQRES